MGQVLYDNGLIELSVEQEKVFLRNIGQGYTLQGFNSEVFSVVPRLKITKFTALQSALRDGISGTIEIGVLGPLIDLSVSSDQLLVEGTILMTAQQFEDSDPKVIVAAIMETCQKEKIVYGIQADQILKDLRPMEKIVIAIGKSPINGLDAQVTMYTIEDVEPQIVASGEVDHYELNVINKVEDGEWLGERIEPTNGFFGINVFGQEMPPIPGQQENLRFDPISVISVVDEEKGITTLRAKRNGAVVYNGEMIIVLNAIYLDGDVSFATGNIDFDGFVEITQTVEDNFFVVASENIQVLGEMGVGAVELIESKHGDVYIKGGIAGKNKAVIKAKKNVYTKFASDCTIICDGTVHIGFYAMNCNITAKEIILDAPTSKIIGGHLTADVKVVTNELGGRAGILTKVTILGFDRAKLEKDYEVLKMAVEMTKGKIETYKSELDTFGKKEIKKSDYERYEAIRQNHKKSVKRLATLYETQKNYVSYLHAKGFGEVLVKGKIYGNVLIKIKDEQILVKEGSSLPCHYFYNEDGLQVL